MMQANKRMCKKIRSDQERQEEKLHYDENDEEEIDDEVEEEQDEKYHAPFVGNTSTIHFLSAHTFLVFRIRSLVLNY